MSAARTLPATSLLWFARHELLLAWRDWAAMMAGGRTARERLVTLAVLGFVAGLHWLALAMLTPLFRRGVSLDKPTLVVLTASLLTTFSMMLSQAIEHVTRAFYARADLDLILSSPAPSRHVFAVRIVSIAVTGALMTALLMAPLINAAVYLDGAHWLGAYVVVAAMSALSTAISLAIAMALFATVGPKRTRLIAQIVAAVVGAALLIAIQAVAVMVYGNFSRMQVLQSKAVQALAPDLDSWAYIPARALLGDASLAVTLLAAAAAILLIAVWFYAGRFASNAVATAGAAEEHDTTTRAVVPFRSRTTVQALRSKEWMLLARDPWLMSQTLMQVLYLIPPALMLWRDMGSGEQVHIVLAPVLVMAFGQLAGGLAWLAISGEDAPDLVATAPIPLRALTRAKVEAVLNVIAAGSAPFIVGLAFVSPWGAGVTALGIALASATAIVIQLWFKSAAKRAMFRRRQISSRGATFAEAFSSIFWAASAGFAAAQSVFALVFVALALLTLGITRVVRPPV